MNQPLTNDEISRRRPAPLSGFSHIKRYWDPEHQMFAAKILPGEFYVTRLNEIIVTVLGSCVSACIRDPIAGIGGMNHFMLPSGDKLWAGLPENLDPLMFSRYGNFAMERMINTILKHGGSREHLEIKIFGGGSVLDLAVDIGLQNIRFVKEYIRTEKLTLLAEDVGDRYPRKVYYFPESGKVRVMRLRTLHNNTIIDREVIYREEIESREIVGKVELFE
jgi:chemotaxis protein CheD